jgi:hypothetical protein
MIKRLKYTLYQPIALSNQMLACDIMLSDFLTKSEQANHIAHAYLDFDIFDPEQSMRGMAVN